MKRSLNVVLLLLVVSIGFPNRASCIPLYDMLLDNFELLPEYYTKFDLSTFAFHKNTYFKQEYLAEVNSGVDLEFLSFRKLLYSDWNVRFKLGLGELPDNVIFSVLNIHFFINPTIELRLPAITAVVGAEHLCVHEVDRKNYPIVHYNTLSIALKSPNMRVNQYWIPLSENNGWVLRNRLAWYIAFIGYMKDGLGIAGPNKVNGFNAFSEEIKLDGRYAFAKRRSWVFTVRDQFRFGRYDRTFGVVDHPGWYWREDIGFESLFRKGKRGAAFYCDFILDDLPPVQAFDGTMLPLFSKDKLLEIGVSFFN
jgi:hypothetical protein